MCAAGGWWASEPGPAGGSQGRSPEMREWMNTDVTKQTGSSSSSSTLSQLYITLQLNVSCSQPVLLMYYALLLSLPHETSHSNTFRPVHRVCGEQVSGDSVGDVGYPEAETLIFMSPKMLVHELMRQRDPAAAHT